MRPTDLRPRPGRGVSADAPGVGHAHGKAILLGEHAVVYGAPALVLPLPRLTVTATATRFPGTNSGPDRITVAVGEPGWAAVTPVAVGGPGRAAVTPVATDGLRHLVTEFKKLAGRTGGLCADIVIESAVPPSRGLGSSAACGRAAALALVEAYGHRLDPGQVYDLVQSSERVAHGRASGIDAVATGAASLLVFRSGTAGELPHGHPRATFVIGDSGAPGNTKEAVALVARRPSRCDAFVDQVAALTTRALGDLDRGDLPGFGGRLTENHRLLHELGVSTPRIDSLVQAALNSGALGAKLTGGGLGGCMLAMTDEPTAAEQVAAALRAAGAERTWIVRMPGTASHD